MKLLLVGAGKMGNALLAGWLKHHSADSIRVIEPNPISFENVRRFISLDELDIVPNVIVFAVKPQMLDAVLPPYGARFDNALIISIAAGKTLSSFRNYFSNNPLVRAMPNLPASIGKGMTVLCASNANDEQKTLALDLFKAVGEALWLDENLIDAATALSGSGPAYTFYFMQSLARAAEKLGLPKDVALTLAVNTVHGAAHLALKSSDSLGALQNHVISPGGTTEAALKVLDPRLQELFDNALLAACQRAKELN